MAEFHRWAAETGYGAQRSSPLCLGADRKIFGQSQCLFCKASIFTPAKQIDKQKDHNQLRASN